MNLDELLKQRHTLSHVLARVILKRDPEVKFAIGPATDTGFYYDFEFSEGKTLSESDLAEITKEMRAFLKEGFTPERNELSKEDAQKLFTDQPYKLELIGGIEAGEAISTYTMNDFTDLCEGPHVASSNDIDPEGFTLSHIAGAYWRGDEKNKMLTRIYGLAFENKVALDAYLLQREEAKKRDHRKLAREQDLLVFSDLVGSGMPLWTPRGNILRNAIIGYSRELNAKLGFQEVHTPNINKAELFKISGHYDKYKEDMLSVHSQYVDEEMFLKPMNCPQHTQIYASRPRSYRDLPIRYSDFANLYRDERPGELSGLTRLRMFAQDDGHVFCREDQIEEEISNILNAIEEVLHTYKIDYWMRLSLRDPNNTGKYLGDDAVWEHSQSILEQLLKDKKINYKSEEGEAAFYGPKIDIMAVDALNREWQISTIQLDFSMPNRFKLTYTDKDGIEKTPVMIHRALVGSPDRFLGILIEHLGGNFPLWLSPVQVEVLPIAEAHLAYAQEVASALKEKGIRVELDESNETLGKKIRNAKMEKVPYFLVIGDAEVSAREVTLESRDDGKVGSLSIEQLLEKLTKEIAERK
jgi:threonyl-tRNA synthetase